MAVEFLPGTYALVGPSGSMTITLAPGEALFDVKLGASSYTFTVPNGSPPGEVPLAYRGHSDALNTVVQYVPTDDSLSVGANPVVTFIDYRNQRTGGLEITSATTFSADLLCPTFFTGTQLPEPSAWSLLILGIGFLGYWLRLGRSLNSPHQPFDSMGGNADCTGEIHPPCGLGIG